MKHLYNFLFLIILLAFEALVFASVAKTEKDETPFLLSENRVVDLRQDIYRDKDTEILANLPLFSDDASSVLYFPMAALTMAKDSDKGYQLLARAYASALLESLDRYASLYYSLDNPKETIPFLVVPEPEQFVNAIRKFAERNKLDKAYNQEDLRSFEGRLKQIVNNINTLKSNRKRG